MSITSIEDDLNELRRLFGELHRATIAVRGQLVHLVVADGDRRELMHQIDGVLDAHARLHTHARAALRRVED